MFYVFLYCILVACGTYPVLIYFKLDFIGMIIEKYKFNNGVCKTYGNKFKRHKPNSIHTHIDYECTSCSKYIQIHFDCIDKTFLKKESIVKY